MSEPSLFQHSEEAMGKLLSLEHRIRDLYDWLQRAPLPPKWSVVTYACEGHETPQVMLVIEAPTRMRAIQWMVRECKCADPRWGIASAVESTDPPMFTVHMPDFSIQLSFPTPNGQPSTATTTNDHQRN